MKQSRRFRFVTALVALVGILFMQFAVATYACPSLQLSHAEEAAVMPMDERAHAMDACDQMPDTSKPAVCQVHSQAGNQSLDKPAPPDVSPFVAITMVSAIIDRRADRQPLSSHAGATWLKRESAPPLSIRNCCFRI